jgi:peptide/nickel transport system ATP-binding protein
VRGVTLSVERGETLCIVGESGCGKSLTALAIMGLLPRRARRRARRLALDGIDLMAASDSELADLRGSRMAMIFQEPMTSLNPCYTVGNQMEEMLLRHRKATRREARDRAVQLLEKVGMTAAASRLGQYPHQLSGGLRQRVMIAMVMMCNPDLIIADEPTTALDVTIQAQILLLLAELRREFGMGLVLITHDLGIVARIADRVSVMYAGEIVETGPIESVFREPRHPYTLGLLRSVPDFENVRESFEMIAGLPPDLVSPPTGCRFHPRCAFVQEDCVEGEFPLRPLSRERATACIHNELAAASARAEPVLRG